ncbi:uncharacterized protein MKK02DRAFT_40509 [Dioszegia hungarica]|uniref:BTB domain-containing protein n=1 Tax=Dioszegia hungarica TaxID=4972 RepID=A0AA38H3Q6_9TREE|nr:uncharacterized protein MKK02DRAFT_40509 [Dioszegia hungarica]KAI9632209.1 hypothetical protein MKK02DRAFT_40509 [Dioszegia hungarica]
MPQCWDARGLEYTICRDFKDNDESDFVLLSRGTFRWAYPCLKAQVADVSPVFREMFANDSLKDGELHLGVDALMTELFLNHILPKQYPSRFVNTDWNSILPVCNLLRQYECTSLADQYLYQSSLYDPKQHRFAAFVLACQADHLQAACRLLKRAGPSETSGSGKGASLRPASQSWTAKDVDGLSTAWLWALTCAVQWADKLFKLDEDGNRTGDAYWTAVVGDFMSRMTSYFSNTSSSWRD